MDNNYKNEDSYEDEAERERIKKIMAKPISLKASAWYWKLTGKLECKEYL